MQRPRRLADSGITKKAPTLQVSSGLAYIALVQWANEHAIQAWLLWNFRHNCREAAISESVDDYGRPTLRDGSELQIDLTYRGLIGLRRRR